MSSCKITIANKDTISSWFSVSTNVTEDPPIVRYKLRPRKVNKNVYEFFTAMHFDTMLERNDLYNYATKGSIAGYIEDIRRINITIDKNENSPYFNLYSALSLRDYAKDLDEIHIQVQGTNELPGFFIAFSRIDDTEYECEITDISSSNMFDVIGVLYSNDVEIIAGILPYPDNKSSKKQNKIKIIDNVVLKGKSLKNKEGKVLTQIKNNVDTFLFVDLGEEIGGSCNDGRCKFNSCIFISKNQTTNV